MSRKRKGLPIDGWLAIDKPVGIGSTQVVSQVRRLTNAAKVGHGGTLDPLASGILPIALGEATKTVAHVMDGSKTYRFQVRWGEATATDDREGDVVERSDHRPDAAAIAAVLGEFVGAISQVPPAYSALKVDGERAYDLARAGEQVVLQPRVVQIIALRLLAQPDADHADFEVQCGKGTYVRSLGRDIARRLGTLGHLSALRRTVCGPFNETNAIPLDNFREVGQGPALRSHLLPIETALDDIPALALTEVEARRLHMGQVLAFNRLELPQVIGLIGPDQTIRAMQDGRLAALARIENGVVRSVRVMNVNPQT